MILFDIPLVLPALPAVAGEVPDAPMLAAALWTAVIEVPLFALCGYRGARELALFAGVNVVSNLLLNGFLAAAEWPWGAAVAAGEAGVLLLEYALCRYFVPDRGRLFATLFVTNAASCLAGLAYAAWAL